MKGVFFSEKNKKTLTNSYIKDWEMIQDFEAPIILSHHIQHQVSSNLELDWKQSLASNIGFIIGKPLSFFI